VPVINGLTNEFHPCQILADIFTYIEHRGSIQGKTVAWVGDGNNMANTWLQAAELLGFTVHLSTPSGYEVDQAVAGLRSTDSYKIFKDPEDACRGADLVTTDVWTSPTPCSCTACPRTAAKKSAPKSSTARNRSSGTKPKTACMCKRRSWSFCCWARSIDHTNRWN
jgi:hypothetical protein